MSQQRTVISTGAAPAAIGPYSQAIAVSNLVFCSGQIPLSPESGQLVGAGDVAAQTEQVMKNLQAVLAAAGCSFADVARCTIYLSNMGDFANRDARRSAARCARRNRRHRCSSLVRLVGQGGGDFGKLLAQGVRRCRKHVFDQRR